MLEFWASLDLEDARRTAAAVREFLPELLAAFGDVAATVAADYFDELRSQTQTSALFTALLADAASSEQIQRTAGWALADLFAETPDPTGSLDKIAQVIQRLTLQPARQTIAVSAAEDPDRPRWARVPTGDKTCAFCLVMASRGAVYLTEESAGAGMTAFHGDCDCVPTPTWDNDALPEGYEPDALYTIYNKARHDAGSGSLKQILAQLRINEGIA